MNAVADVMAAKYNTDKSNILDPVSDLLYHFWHFIHKVSDTLSTEYLDTKILLISPCYFGRCDCFVL